MNWFLIVKGYYDDGFYTKDEVKVFVDKNKITEDQFLQITGQVYVA